MNLKKLSEPFGAKDIEWRIGRAGAKNGGVWATGLAYVQNRAIMARLDEVCGPENWCNQFIEWHNTSQLCGIGIKCGGEHSWKNADEWVWKWDGADNTHIEATKGGLSDSMKRAAVQWGIGRDLYELDETFLNVSTEKKPGWKYAKDKNAGVFYWEIPDIDAVRKGIKTPPKPSKPAVNKVTDAQRKQIGALVKAKQISDLMYGEMLEGYKAKKTVDLTTEQAQKIIDHLNELD